MTSDHEPRPDEVIRLFVAVATHDEVRRGLREFQEALKKVGAKVGWVAPENAHLTLVFLGDVFRSQVEALSASLDSVAAHVGPFSYEAVEAGFFGSPRSPRVIWVGIRETSGALARLQAEVADVVRGLGIRTEERAFKPHLTLGRVRSSDRADELTSLLASAKNTSYGLVKVERLLLMQSHLEHQGVRYSILHASALKGAQ